MKKPELALKIARYSGVTKAEAADHLDRVVTSILARLRRGESAELPGLGSFRQIEGGRIQFEQEDKSRG